MKAITYSGPQILSILRQAEGGVPVVELCREHGMSSASFYKWRATPVSKVAGATAAELEAAAKLAKLNPSLIYFAT